MIGMNNQSVYRQLYTHEDTCCIHYSLHPEDNTILGFPQRI
jgi:hypothetical protein